MATPYAATPWRSPPSRSDRRGPTSSSTPTRPAPHSSSTEASERWAADRRRIPTVSRTTRGASRMLASVDRRASWRCGSCTITATPAIAARRARIASATGSSRGSMPATRGMATRPAAVRPATATAKLSATFDMEMPRSMSARSSSATAASTYHESSGPDSSARLTPSTPHATMNASGVRATRTTAIAARSRTPAARSTGRRPSVSASPPVGSSRTRTTTDIVAATMPISSNDRPRSRHQHRRHRQEQPRRGEDQRREHRVAPAERAAGHVRSSSSAARSPGSGKP